MAGKLEKFTFDDLTKYCPGYDIERFRDDFDTLLDMNGLVFSQSVGFHFGLDVDDQSRQARFEEMVKLFQPVALWAGNDSLRLKLKTMGHHATRFSFFEGGGFMVVLKIPFERLPNKATA